MPTRRITETGLTKTVEITIRRAHPSGRPAMRVGLSRQKKQIHPYYIKLFNTQYAY